MALILFITFLTLLAWSFLLYPLVMYLLSINFPTPVAKDSSFPGKVSMVVAAHNEEDVIRDKVQNCLMLDFGTADWEIIIVSDGSTDDTNMILSEYIGTSPRLHIFSYEQRAGKPNALNVGVSHASGDVLIFSDANVMLEPDAPRNLLVPFADPMVGAACGKVLVRPRGTDEIAGESLYMKFEGMVQRAEGRFWSMVGIDGALFALRKELFRHLEPGIILDDFTLSMEAPLAGKRIVYVEDACAIEEAIALASNELKRKIRIVSGGYQYLAGLLNKKVRMDSRVWFSFVSHKILRWAAPMLMIGTLVSNVFLLRRSLFNYFLTGQAVFYFLALGAHCIPRLRKLHIFYIPYYFCIVNLAALIGAFRFLSAKQNVLWDKVER